MKQGRSLPEVLTELQHQNAAKQDYIGAAKHSDWMMTAAPSISGTITVSEQLRCFTVRWHRHSAFLRNTTM